MKSSHRLLRHLRYRWAGWLQGTITFTNLILIAFILGMILLVLTVQKLEENAITGNVFDSVPLPFFSKPEKKVITTKKPVIIHPCPELYEQESLQTKLYVKNPIKKPKKKNEVRNKTNMMLKGEPKFSKILPAIKVYYTPKVPRPMKFKKATQKLTTSLNETKIVTPLDKNLLKVTRKSTEIMPDVYRVKSMAKRSASSVLNGNTSRVPKDCIPFDKWRRINDPKDKIKVLAYSAFWDDRFDKANIRIMAVMPTKRSPTVYCKVKTSGGSYINSTATKKIMNEHWRLKYASYFLSCEITKTSTPPTEISLSVDIEHQNFALLQIHNNKADHTSPRGNIAVCVKPLHYFYDRATWLLEFIELHQMLGVDHFFFYNHTVGPNVNAVLKHYQTQGIVTVLPWQLGIRSQKEIRTEGIFSSLNDCLFRTMYLFSYTIMLDFDEYIIPREHDTYQDMIHQLEQENKMIRGRPGSFVFRNTFFYLYWENDTTSFGVEPEKPPDWLPYLITQYKTRRLTTSMKPGSRSKYIVIPERAVEVGNHVVWRHTSGSRAIHVPDKIALLHHYRICEFGGYSCLKKSSVVDQVAIRFGPNLLYRVQRKCKHIFNTDERCPLSPPLGSPW